MDYILSTVYPYEYVVQCYLYQQSMHFCPLVGIQGPPGPQGPAGKQHAFLVFFYIIFYDTVFHMDFHYIFFSP